MNKLALATLAVAAILLPSVARAQTAPTPQMQQIHQNMMQLHRQARSSVLAALTPAHRALLSQVVGRLATDPNPDVAGAARTLDAALTPAESQTIVRIAANTHTQARQLMQQAFAQMPNRPVDHDMANKRPGQAKMRNNDAGYILLRLSMPHSGMEHSMGHPM
ncbi:MAG: hypothetical protein M3160_09365 [Candidatus Eremiobacteraeota bacterium]|nr:hypothetical protein [Candidatus Eremiobacteraeota bacterium]